MSLLLLELMIGGTRIVIQLELLRYRNQSLLHRIGRTFLMARRGIWRRQYFEHVVPIMLTVVVRCLHPSQQSVMQHQMADSLLTLLPALPHRI